MKETIIFRSSGHGPDTSGKRSPDGSLREFQFNLDVGKRFDRIMEQYEKVQVIAVNKENEDTPLKTRTAIANNFMAKNKKAIENDEMRVFYMSFHANAFGNGGWVENARGSETLIYGKDNALALELAKSIEANVSKSTGQPTRGVKYRPDLHEMRETHMTAILHEAAFMTSKKDLALLKTNDFRQRVAQGVADAFIKHLNLQKKEYTPETPGNVPNSSENKNGLYLVQVGAFSSEANAEQQKAALEKAGFPAYIKKQ